MPNIKLTYFPILARGFPVRVACELKKIPLDLDVVPFDKWFGGDLPKDRTRFPTANVPVLTGQNGEVITETPAIYAYVGMTSGLWPTDPVGVARALEMIGMLEYFFTGAPEFEGDTGVIPTMQMQGDKLKAVREGVCTDRLKFSCRRINDIVGDDGFAVGGKLSIVDFMLAQVIQDVRAGQWTHISPKCIEECGRLNAVADRTWKDPALKPIIDALYATMKQ